MALIFKIQQIPIVCYNTLSDVAKLLIYQNDGGTWEEEEDEEVEEEEQTDK